MLHILTTGLQVQSIAVCAACIDLASTQCSLSYNLPHVFAQATGCHGLDAVSKSLNKAKLVCGCCHIQKHMYAEFRVEVIQACPRQAILKTINYRTPSWDLIPTNMHPIRMVMAGLGCGFCSVEKHMYVGPLQQQQQQQTCIFFSVAEGAYRIFIIQVLPQTLLALHFMIILASISLACKSGLGLSNTSQAMPRYGHKPNSWHRTKS